MKYNGIELHEITEPQIFNPPKEVLVWDDCDAEAIMQGNCDLKRVKSYGIIADTGARVICLDYGDMVFFEHCAEIPEEPKPRRVTNRELAQWLVLHGEVLTRMHLPNGHSREMVTTFWHYVSGEEDVAVDCDHAGQKVVSMRSDAPRCIGVRKWGDTDWHDPTADYVGLEDTNGH